MQNDNRLGKIAVFFRDDVIRSFASAQDDRGGAPDDRDAQEDRGALRRTGALRMTGALWMTGGRSGR